MRLKLLTFFILLAFFALSACAWKGDKQLLPIDDELVLPFSGKTLAGTLENGFKYYIRYNDFPPDKIELILNVRTGSLNETEEERGVAHFVEHMAFNGTKNYKSNDLIKFMEAAGLVFGKDSNAYTSYKETRYLLTIPADNPALLEDGLGILRDWVDGVAFDPQEIEKEKGVITEEWRSRNDANSRVRRKSTDYFYYGSKYPEREAIGLMEVVAGADRALLKGYYDKWYTAANSAIIIVGNIDAAEVEEKVKRYFSTLAKKDTPEKADSSIPLQNGVRFGIVTDPELNDTFFSINFFVEEGEITTYRELKRYILEAGALSMLNRRVGGAILEKEIDLLSFRGAKTSLDDNNLSVLRFIVNSKPESIEEDFKTALIEIERAKRFGFTAEELKEYTATQKTFIDRAASPDYKYPSERFAEAIADYDTNGGHFTEFSQDKVLLDKIFSETEIDDYNRAFNSLIESKSELVLITAPEMEKGKIAFTEEIFSRIKNETAAMQLEPRKAEAVVDSLIDALPKGGEVQSRTKYESLNGELITYTNGVRLFIKKNPIDRGHFAFSARKPGGHSSLNNSDALYIDLLPQIISASGFENITRRQLQILTAGRQARVQFRVVEYMFELMGGGDSEDLEIFFQLLYKYFTSANVDENAFSAIIKASETNLANTEKDRMTAFFRDAAREMNNGKYRRNYLLSSDLASVAPDALLKLYKDNFEDAGNFIFVLSGDLDIDLTVELGRIYLGGLAEPEKKSAALSRGVKLNKPFGIKEGNGDVEKKSTVQIRFDNDIKPFENGEYVIALARRILYQRIRENIREDKGGAYSVNVAVGYSKYPDASFFGRIFFTCDPERKDELIKEIRAILDKFAKDGVNEDELAVAKAQQTALYESVKDDNSFWANDISYCITAGDKLLSADEYKDLINSITLASVNRAVSTFMEGMRTFIAVYNPEDKR